MKPPWLLAMVIAAFLRPDPTVIDGPVQPGATIADVTRATRKCFANTIHAVGHVVPRATGVVLFNAPGSRITEILVKPGDAVRSGAAIAAVVAGGSTPPDAKPAPDPGPSATAGNAVRATTLVAGTVVSTGMSLGMLTPDANTRLATLAVDGDLEVAVDVPAFQVPDLSPGQGARVRVDRERDFQGHVRTLPAEIDRRSHFGQARVTVDGQLPLEVGRRVDVAVETARSCGIAVPLAALSGTRATVRLQTVKKFVVETHPVRIGLRDAEDAEVEEGVAEGDLVVASAGTSLRNGDRVGVRLAGDAVPR